MNFEKIEENYYPQIYNRIRFHVPQFNSLWHENPDLVYPILFEFRQYLLEHIQEQSCWDFINEALSQGGVNTENAIVMQVFWDLYDSHEASHIALNYLDIHAKAVFEEFKIKYLNSVNEDKN
jgi:hypothetical protein